MKKSVTVALGLDSGVAPFPAAQWREALAWAKRSGADGVELSVPAPAGIPLEELLAELDTHRLPVSTIATGLMTREGLVFCSQDQSLRRAAVERIGEHIHLAARLPGRPNVTIGLVRGQGGGGPQELCRQRQWIVDCLRDCLELAAGRDIRLNLEPFNRYESVHLNETASAAELIEELGAAEMMGILYDTFHSNIEDADMAATIRRYGPLFSHVHLADSNRRLPGEGHIDFDAVLAALEEVSYRHYLSLEVLNSPSARHIIDHLTHSDPWRKAGA